MVTVPARPAAARLVDVSTVPETRQALVWSFTSRVLALSSAPVGGGSAGLDWLVNVGVVRDYARTDLAHHAAEVAARIGLTGTGAALFTAVPVERAVRADDGGVVVDATVGVTRPTWAADADGARGGPGTVNIVVQVPVALSPAAAVNAVITATEAKVQALVEAGIPGTGTASDAVVVCWPASVPVEDFAGPRSTWGARIARATHRAVADGLAVHP
jgi:adenosylcobinamide hydrolase